MKNDKALEMISDLRQLVDRWELELDAKPLWWRKPPVPGGGKIAATGSAAAIGSLTAPAPGRTKLQSPSPRKVVKERKAPSYRPHRGGPKTGRRGPADQARNSDVNVSAGAG